MRRKRPNRTRASALLSSVLVLTTCLMFIEAYVLTERYYILEDQLVVKYLLGR
ncbi:hypothetical protein OCH80_09505 [Lactobacillus sp. 23-2]|uniref:hypothetical protein n=1 Tax=Lactobacillus sp. 23-2 TaxID=2981842 RepID=UPI003837F27B